MKISPLAQGSGLPAQQANPTAQTIDPGRLARAKAIASGQQPEEIETTGDPQADKAKASVRRIQMKTQVSTNRDDAVVASEPLVEDSVAKPYIDEPIAEVAEETKPLSPQFVALAKAKRALQIEKAQLEKEKAELAQKSSFSGDEYVSKADLKSKPLSVMLENGVTYDQLTEAIIAQQAGNTPEIIALKAELAALKEHVGNQFTTRDQLAEQQVLSDIQREIVETVKSEPEKYDAVHEAKAEKVVKDLIHRTWKKTGEVLDTREAIELVNNQLIDEALPFAKLQSVQKRLTPAEAAQVQVELPTPKPNTKIMRTLTNRDTASPIMDRRARAIAAMTGTLKKG